MTRGGSIGVFDSGLGGLTAVRQIIRLAPGEDIIYFGDTARVPYGNRSAEVIIRYARQAIAFLLTKRVKFLIDACGTMSSALDDNFTSALPVPYIGVIDAAAKAALAASRNKRIGVIATAATINSSAFQNALKKEEPEARIFSVSCPLFVPLVENGYIERDNTVTRLVAEEYLADMRENDIDTLILGCTHYPLIAELISGVMGRGVTLIDSGFEAAKAALELMPEGGAREGGRLEVFTSDCPLGFAAIAAAFLGQRLENTARVDIEEVPAYILPKRKGE